MLRRSLITALLLGVLLAIAPAAHAKGPTDAAIEGPGLTPAVHVDSYTPVGNRPSMSDLMTLTGADRVMFDLTTRLAIDAPAAPLGQRYTVSYRQPGADGKTMVVLRQDVYPFASGGPVTYTPPGQLSVFITGSTLATGWYKAPAKLRPVFTTLGARPHMVTPGPASAQQAPPPANTSSGPGTAAVLMWIGGSLVVGAALIAAGSAVLPRWRRPGIDHAGPAAS